MAQRCGTAAALCELPPQSLRSIADGIAIHRLPSIPSREALDAVDAKSRTAAVLIDARSETAVLHIACLRSPRIGLTPRRSTRLVPPWPAVGSAIDEQIEHKEDRNVHATVQKPLKEILDALGDGEKVMVVGCGNCAAKARSGGEPETEAMVERLRAHGVTVTGWAVPPDGGSLCKLSATEKLLRTDHKDEADAADSFLVLACGQGVHTVIDTAAAGMVHPGCDTIFGGETISDSAITEYCSLCGECVLESTGGLCPVTLCAKSLLNGPCGGAKDGKCEVDPQRDCGWELIFDRLKQLGRIDSMLEYQPPKNWLRSGSPRSLVMDGKRVDFSFANRSVSAWSGAEEPPENMQEGGDS